MQVSWLVESGVAVAPVEPSAPSSEPIYGRLPFVNELVGRAVAAPPTLGDDGALTIVGVGGAVDEAFSVALLLWEFAFYLNITPNLPYLPRPVRVTSGVMLRVWFFEGPALTAPGPHGELITTMFYPSSVKCGKACSGIITVANCAARGVCASGRLIAQVSPRWLSQLASVVRQ
jgi:hypothetical protein